MSQAYDPSNSTFIDRRNINCGVTVRSGQERRQFMDSREGLSPGARELAQAIDSFKLRNRRRYITHEEMLHVILELGYRKAEPEENEQDAFPRETAEACA